MANRIRGGTNAQKLSNATKLADLYRSFRFLACRNPLQKFGPTPSLLLQSADIAQKVLKVKTRDPYLFKTSKIIKIGSLSQKLQANEKFGFFFEIKPKFR